MKNTPDTSIEERVGAAQAGIAAVLKKYNCALDAQFTFAQGRLSPGISILAMEEPPAAPKKARGKKNTAG